MRLFTPFYLLSCIFPLFLKAQINVNFNANYIEICTPGVVQFTDNSTSSSSTIVQWEWKRNGIVFSNLQNPALFFGSSGSYQICLKVTDNLGISDSLCINNYITAYRSPTANFVANQFLGCRPYPVQFTDSSLLGDAPIRQWRWDFGDGFIDTINQHPNHIYNTVGTFDVTLVVIDTNGCSHSLLRNNLITITEAVTAGISHNATQVQCGLPASVTFTGLSNSANHNYTWFFGDATLGTGQVVAHNYLGSGCYSPTLVVSNGLCSASATVTSCITVSDRPTASFTVANPTACYLPYTPIITNQSTGQTTNQWNFGDGFLSNAFQPSHPYTDYTPQDSINYLDGVFPIVLTVSNALGCSSRDTQIVYVSDLQSYILFPQRICAPDTVAIHAVNTPTGSAFSPVNWIWTADQLLSSSGGTIFVNYLDSGLYNVHVIVTDNIGCQDTVQRIILVGIPPIIDSIYTDTNFVCHITGINFIGHGSSYIDQWTWIFSDESSSFEDSFHHHFIDTGFITGYVIAGFRGCVDSFALDSYYIIPPIAQFTLTINCNNFLASFIDESIGAHHWFWDFGDTTTLADTSTLQNPSYTYPGAGLYQVWLVVWNDSTGCIDSFRHFVQIGDVSANFTIPDSLCVPATVIPDNLSNNALSYFWSAPSSSPFSATQAEPTIIYNSPGIYTIRLSAFDINGCRDTISKIIHIAGIDTNIIHSPTPACRPATVSFTDASIGVLSPIVSRVWGNGSTLPTLIQNYSFPGPQVMNLTVTNSWGCTFPLSERVNVGGAFINFSSNQNICIGNLFTGVAITSSGANANAFRPFTYIWDYGDGDRDTTTNLVQTHLYATPGTYTVCLYVLDTIGCVTTLCRPNWVTVHDPTAVFTADTFYSSCPPLEVNFSNLSLSGSQWAWNFGDGSVSNLENPTHVYSTPGFYTVSLAVTAFAGCAGRDTIFQMIQITGPTGSFNMPPVTHCAPYTQEFTAMGNNVAAYTWLFGNGDSQTHLSNAATGFSRDTTYYTYSQPGVYNPTLVMMDGMGCQIPIERGPITILAAPTANFISDSLACQSDTIHYQLLTPLVSNLSVQWLFEGGFPNSSTDFQPNIYYPDTGSFDVQLIISLDGCYDTLLRPNYISIKSPPIANFGISPNLCAPTFVQFSDSSFANQGFIQTWAWDLGNGQTASSADTALWYYIVDTFDISLIIENNFGCKDTVYQSFQTFPTPFADAGNYPTICSGDTIQLQGAGNGNFLWTSMAWLSDSTISNPLTTLDSTHIYILEIYNNFGCNAFDTVEISVAPTPFANAGNYPTICSGDTIQLQGAGNGNFLWTSSTWLSDSTISNPLTTLDSNHIYILEIYNSFGCNTFDTVEISVAPFVLVDAGDSLFICLGDTVHLQGTSTITSFDWGNEPSLSCQFCSNPIAYPTNTHIYYLQPSISSNCFNRDSVVVVVYPLPIAQIIADTAICVGDTLELLASGGQIYNWLAGSNLSNTTISNPTATPNTNSIYTVEITDNNGCKDTTSVYINILNNNFTPLPDQTICFGDSAFLNISNGSNPIWLGNALSCTSCIQTIAYPTDSSEYFVSYYNTNNCLVRDSLWVNIIDLTSFQALQSDTICVGDTVQLYTIGLYNATIIWLPNYALSANNIPSPIAYPSTDTYYVAQIQQGTCANNDTVYISVLPMPNILSTDTSYCVGDTAQLFAFGNTLNYTWSPSSFLSDSTISNPIVTATSNQQYQIIGTNPCGSDTTYSNITVLQYPTIQIDSSITAVLGTTITLQAQTDSNALLSWSPSNDLSCTNCPNPSWLVNGEAVFYITATNILGCSSRDSIVISLFSECISDLVFVPNAFTPDGDGYNDVLYAQSGVIQEIKIFQIYNRWGQLVFETKDMLQGWDGKFQGKPCSPDVFGYYLIFNCPNEEKEILKKGNITILK